jgi:DUF1680 family protein
VSCCTSSITRGLALLPAIAWGRRGSGIAVNLYAPGRVRQSVAEPKIPEVDVECHPRS